MYYKGIGVKDFDKNKKYRMKDVDKSIYFFHHVPRMSSAEETIYEHVFPVYRYHAAVTLESRFLLYQETGDIVIDVFDSGSKGIYGPWYYDESGIHERINKIINNNIVKEMKKLGIIEVKETTIKREK